MASHVLDSLYFCAGTLLLPRLVLKMPFSRRHRAGLKQRMGYVPESAHTGKNIWIHCASVGEASIPRRLVQHITREYPHLQPVFSSCTDTGVERLQKLYPENAVFFLPFDLSPCIKRALERIKPSALLLVEQELWPNLLLECYEKNIPVAVVNGRMNEVSSRLNRAIFRLLPKAQNAVKMCCTRSQKDAERFIYSGFDREKVYNTGSLKYEALKTSIEEKTLRSLREQFQIDPDDEVIVGGSTHEGEELVLADIWTKLRECHPSVHLILAPRHIERAGHIVAALRKKGLKIVLKTELDRDNVKAGKDSIVVIDTIGRLTDCYALATAVFVGRSLFPPGGGQNMMEPAALGKPVAVGEYTKNFKPEMRQLTALKAVETVESEKELEKTIQSFIENKPFSALLGKRAQKAVVSNKGATKKTVELLNDFF